MSEKKPKEKTKAKVEWNKGWPQDRGLFKCRVDGKETYLVHHRCDLNRRHWWSDTKGYDVIGCSIEWTGGPLSADDLG